MDDAQASVALREHNGLELLREADIHRHQGELISKLASNRYAVDQDTDVYNLAEAMEKAPQLFAVGVVDNAGAPLGLISRQQLFDNLGKMYGRDLFKRKQVSAMVTPARAFRDDMNIFAVAELLRDDLHRMDDTWYVLVTASGAFSGVFSTRNLLIYLSDTTARELSLARRLQTAIVQERFEENDPRFDLVCSSRMAKEVGGDFYVVKMLDGARTLIGLCDVSGKGIAASLVTAVLGGIFDGYSASGSLPEFLTRLNRYLYDTFRLEYFVTGVFIELNRDTGEASICDMGHSYVLIMRGKALMRLSRKALSPPLGVARDVSPSVRNYRFGHGDLALVFTDGVIEQSNRQGEEYGEVRLWKALRSNASLPAANLRDALLAELEGYRGEQPQGDDVTFVILRYR